MSDYVLSSYLDDMFQPERRRLIVKGMLRIILTKVGIRNFDAIAFTGISGATIAPILAFILDKPLIAVRKDSGAHSCYKAEGLISAEKILIIDDLIESGSTIATIMAKVLESCRVYRGAEAKLPEFIGVALFRDTNFGLSKSENLNRKFKDNCIPSRLIEKFHLWGMYLPRGNNRTAPEFEDQALDKPENPS